MLNYIAKINYFLVFTTAESRTMIWPFCVWVLLLFIHCLLKHTLLVRVLCFKPLYCYALLCELACFAIISLGEERARAGCFIFIV